MRTLKNCPSKEKILEFSCFSGALSFFEKLSIKMHLFHCQKCKEKNAEAFSHWQNVFHLKNDFQTESLLNVYSRLQKDETLILKGWKLENPTFRGSERFALSKTLNVGLAVITLVVISTFTFLGTNIFRTPNQVYSLKEAPRNTLQAKVKIKDRNRVQTHYLEPQLIRMVEFETMDQK